MALPKEGIENLLIKAKGLKGGFNKFQALFWENQALMVN